MDSVYRYQTIRLNESFGLEIISMVIKCQTKGLKSFTGMELNDFNKFLIKI